MNKKVSIILPAYNGAETIGRAIESVLAQDVSDWELLILDDGSKDAIDHAVKSYLSDARIQYHKNEQNLGLQKTLNRAMGLAKGAHIARIDQDDAWSDPLKLTKQIAFLDAHPEYVLVGTSALLFDAKGKKIGRYKMPETDHAIRNRMLTKNCFLHPSIMARKAAMEKVGLYGEGGDTYCVEDYDLWLRLGSIGKMANLSDASVAITVHSESMTAKNRVRQAYKIVQLIKRYKKIYPNYILGYMMSMLRLSFFTVTSSFPFLGKFVYRVQVLYKNS